MKHVAILFFSLIWLCKITQHVNIVKYVKLSCENTEVCALLHLPQHQHLQHHVSLIHYFSLPLNMFLIVKNVTASQLS